MMRSHFFIFYLFFFACFIDEAHLSPLFPPHFHSSAKSSSEPPSSAHSFSQGSDATTLDANTAVRPGYSGAGGTRLKRRRRESQGSERGNDEAEGDAGATTPKRRIRQAVNAAAASGTSDRSDAFAGSFQGASSNSSNAAESPLTKRPQSDDCRAGGQSKARTGKGREVVNPYKTTKRSQREYGEWKGQENVQAAPQQRFREVVRNKDQRRAMPGHSCPQCAAFVTAVCSGTNGVFDEKTMLNNCSRHKCNWAPTQTPPDFWDIEFVDERRNKDGGEKCNRGSEIDRTSQSPYSSRASGCRSSQECILDDGTALDVDDRSLTATASATAGRNEKVSIEFFSSPSF